MAKTDPTINTYIAEAYLILGFTNEEWNAMRSFKLHRNGDTHVKFTTSEAYHVVQNLKKPDPNLHDGLIKAINLHDQRYV